MENRLVVARGFGGGDYEGVAWGSLVMVVQLHSNVGVVVTCSSIV